MIICETLQLIYIDVLKLKAIMCVIGALRPLQRSLLSPYLHVCNKMHVSLSIWKRNYGQYRYADRVRINNYLEAHETYLIPVPWVKNEKCATLPSNKVSCIF